MGVSQAVLRGTPRPVAGTPQRRGASRDGGPPSRSPLFTLSFRCCPGASITLSVRPPACPPRPPVSCPRVCVWSSPLPTLPRAPPTPPWLLLARLGSASGRNWQRPPGGRSWVSAAQRLAEPRCVRDPRQVSVGPSQPQAHRVACTVACGASRSGWRHRCRRGRWAGSGPTGVSGGALGGHGCHPGGRAGQRGWAGLGCWMGRTPWAAWSSG